VQAQVLHDDECFLDYGRDRDAISMAILYGFADTSAQCAHSAPLQIEVPGVGEVVVSAHGRNENGELMPMIVNSDRTKIFINRMTFGDSFAPVTELVVSSGIDVAVSQRIVDGIREANIALLEAVSTSASHTPAAVTLREAADIQRSVVVNSPIDGDFTARSAQSPTAKQISEDHFDLGQWGVSGG
jgi:hypothetical protein